MSNKFYSNFKKFIIINHNFLLFLLLIVVVLNIKTPYIVKAPGGTMSLSDRVYINGKKLSNDYNTTYVKVMEGKLAAIIASYIMPNWDLEKYEEYSGDTNLTYDELNEVEKLMMRESNNIAIITALEKADADFKLVNNKVVVYYKYEEYDNKLKIGDEINKCNDLVISNINDLKTCVNNSTDKVVLNVKRKNKEINLDVNTYFDGESKVIGIAVLNDFDISSKYNIKIIATSSESGSSGGFMTALAIYTDIAKLNIPKNIKIAGTGTIEEDEKVGKIDGIKYKLLGSEKDHVDIFFVPTDNYKEALKVKKKYNLKLKLVEVSKVDDAINYLNSITK